ncbi:MAG: DUF1801 domain-containing protein [Lentisphaeria bacterium]|nr:DUF1801 domain-containing protein [Candidatus Neomarinimicrobiota bacterium]MCF7841962.1 DUF1801 domain-containing protein [Lentisphaeria bacterium]
MKPDAQIPDSIDRYIAAFPSQLQEILEKIRLTIREAAPDGEEKMSYQMPTFFLNGNLVHFAVCKRHIGFYPAPSGIQQFQKELSAYKSSKGAVQFPLDQPIPYDVIQQMVLFRAAENREKVKLKRGK